MSASPDTSARGSAGDHRPSHWTSGARVVHDAALAGSMPLATVTHGEMAQVIPMRTKRSLTTWGSFRLGATLPVHR